MNRTVKSRSDANVQLTSTSKRRQRAGRILAPLILMACVAILAQIGCSNRREQRHAEWLGNEYGRVSRSGGPDSVNGTGVLAKMFRAADHDVFTQQRISRRLEQADCIVWFRQRLGAPQGKTVETLQKWLDAQPGRTLIFVGRGYEADIAYWEDLESRVSEVYPIAPQENRDELEDRLLRAKSNFASQLDNYKQANRECDWFATSSINPSLNILIDANIVEGTLIVHGGGDVFVPPEGAEDKIEPTSKINHEDGETSDSEPNLVEGSVHYPDDDDDAYDPPEGTEDKIDPVLSGDELSSYLTSHAEDYFDPVRATSFTGDPSWTEAFDPEGAEILLYDKMSPRGETTPLLDSEHGLIVGSCPEGRGRVITVVNGSFLLNLPLVNHEHRNLAGCLIREIGQDPQTVCFLEVYDSDDDGPAWDGEASDLWRLFLIWPTNILFVHLTVIGFFLILWRWPIFGRPRRAPLEPVGDFSQHIDAMADLLERSGDRVAAQRKIDDFQRLTEELGQRYR